MSNRYTITRLVCYTFEDDTKASLAYLLAHAVMYADKVCGA